MIGCTGAWPAHTSRARSGRSPYLPLRTQWKVFGSTYLSLYSTMLPFAYFVDIPWTGLSRFLLFTGTIVEFPCQPMESIPTDPPKRMSAGLRVNPSFDEACTGLTEVSVVNSFDLPTRATEHPAATSRHLLRHWGFLSLPPALAGGDGQAPAALGAKPLRVQHPGHGVCRCNVPFVGGRTE